jgi:alpha-ketoglutarate-dependent taurine dioxygenase
MRLNIEPITPEIGAFMHVTAEDAVTPEVAAQLLEALNRHHVLVFPQVHMNDDQFLALTAAMGEKHDNAVHRDGSEASSKGLFRVALDKEEKLQRDIIMANDFWHMDGMNYAGPVKATMLKCQSAPKEGGDTGFALLHAAFDALPEAKKNQIAHLRVGHSIGSSLRRVNHQPTAEEIARWDEIFPRMERPLVWKQACGKSSLLIGSTAGDIAGMSPDEGTALLDELLEWATQDRFKYRHKWEDGDLVIFNNPALLHRSYPYSDAAGRVMHRSTLKGYEPFEHEAEGPVRVTANLY